MCHCNIADILLHTCLSNIFILSSCLNNCTPNNVIFLRSVCSVHNRLSKYFLINYYYISHQYHDGYNISTTRSLILLHILILRHSSANTSNSSNINPCQVKYIIRNNNYNHLSLSTWMALSFMIINMDNYIIK
jgi:hypothetical protein